MLPYWKQLEYQKLWNAWATHPQKQETKNLQLKPGESVLQVKEDQGVLFAIIHNKKTNETYTKTFK